ncbi:MAG: hypothetical protein JW829_11475 [Pirellulales bacterium]|nr:hypothetical protein [Pirellulales bacterium]
MEQRENELQWIETYYIFFPSDRRPTLMQIDTALSKINDRCQLENREADEDGLFESILVDAPDDHAAIEISYETGESVTEQSLELAKQLRDELDQEQLRTLVQSDARLDVMHFERVETSLASEWNENEEDDLEEMLDPSSLLLAVDALATLVGGIPIDPASGSVLM